MTSHAQLRDLKLTTPLMHGPDVKALQEAINRDGGVYVQVVVDGQYGPLTEHALGGVAFRLGLVHRDGRPEVQLKVEDPKTRTSNELARAKERAAATAKQGLGLAGVLKHAQGFIGVGENPPGSNRGTPHPDDWERNFGMAAVSWCGCFAGSMVLAAGGHVTSRVAYTPYIEADAKTGASGFATWTTDRSKAGAGWLVLYNWIGGTTPEHVGVVEAFSADHVVAIEGNTSGTNPSDGGMVARMTRPYSFVLGYAKPRF